MNTPTHVIVPREPTEDAVEAHDDMIASEPDDRFDLADAECEVGAVMLRDTLAAFSALAAENTRLREAGQAILDHMHETYKARNGREVGIQGDDGEKCWIVHSDQIEDLRAALQKEPTT